MTGEITLRGRVLPIGGLKEKLLAALRGGIKTVLIPEENAKDLAEIPDNVKSGLEIIPVAPDGRGAEARARPPAGADRVDGAGTGFVQAGGRGGRRGDRHGCALAPVVEKGRSPAAGDLFLLQIPQFRALQSG